MRLIANRPLLGDYGQVQEGEIFDCPDDIAMQLIRDGKARRANGPKVLYEAPGRQYETKPARFETPEVSARRAPFREMYVRHEEPESVAAEGDSDVPVADVPEQGTSDPKRRRRRQGSGAR